jgi:hypothetical protein
VILTLRLIRAIATTHHGRPGGGQVILDEQSPCLLALKLPTVALGGLQGIECSAFFGFVELKPASAQRLEQTDDGL